VRRLPKLKPTKLTRRVHHHHRAAPFGDAVNDAYADFEGEEVMDAMDVAAAL